MSLSLDIGSGAPSETIGDLVKAVSMQLHMFQVELKLLRVFADMHISCAAVTFSENGMR